MWRKLRREGIYLQSVRNWCVRTDQEFARKAAEIVGLFLDPCADSERGREAQHPSHRTTGRFRGERQRRCGAGTQRFLQATWNIESICGSRSRHRPSPREVNSLLQQKSRKEAVSTARTNGVKRLSPSSKGTMNASSRSAGASVKSRAVRFAMKLFPYAIKH